MARKIFMSGPNEERKKAIEELHVALKELSKKDTLTL
jgi:hypothetical protein